MKKNGLGIRLEGNLKVTTDGTKGPKNDPMKDSSKAKRPKT